MPNNSQSPKVKQVEMRPTVEIHLPDGRIFEGPRGDPVETFLRGLPEWREAPVVGAIINSPPSSRYTAQQLSLLQLIQSLRAGD